MSGEAWKMRVGGGGQKGQGVGTGAIYHGESPGFRIHDARPLVASEPWPAGPERKSKQQSPTT